MKKIFGTSILFAVIFLALFAGNSDNSSQQEKAVTHLILQKDKQFSQKDLTINLGDTIVFQNVEKDIIHNVYSITPGNEFEIHHQMPGTKTPILVDKDKHKNGVMVIECAIHPGMKLNVKIEGK